MPEGLAGALKRLLKAGGVPLLLAHSAAGDRERAVQKAARPSERANCTSQAASIVRYRVETATYLAAVMRCTRTLK